MCALFRCGTGRRNSGWSACRNNKTTDGKHARPIWGRSVEMAWSPVFAISVGAACGALLRWQLGMRLNSLLPGLPPGTLAANLIGGYIIGLAIAYLSQAPNLAPEWRLFDHHRLLRRPDDILHFFGRSRHVAAGGPIYLGVGGDRISCHWSLR